MDHNEKHCKTNYFIGTVISDGFVTYATAFDNPCQSGR